MKHRIIKIQKAISEIENPYPKDNLITCYKDFLMVRDYLQYYKFNIRVFESLVNLTCEVWNSNERISRISLLEAIKVYGYHIDKTSGFYNTYSKSSKLSIETKTKLFILFKTSFEIPNRLTPKQIDNARKICNRIIKSRSLESSSEIWLCENFKKSPMILNRVLRYPSKSEVISNWAKQNFSNIKFCNRRPEMVSWFLDKNPDFEIDRQTLIDDFEYLNSIDINALNSYDKEEQLNKLLERDLKGIISSDEPFPFLTKLNNIEPEYIVSSTPLNFTKRYYQVPKDTTRKNYPTSVPDFEKLRDNFYLNIDTTIKITMLWAISYSRLDNSIKTRLFKKYYSEETYRTFFRLCKKHNYLHLLKWLKDKQK